MAELLYKREVNMALRFLWIGGTGAPPQSEWVYRRVLNVAEEFVNEAEYESIFMLGFGNMKSAAKHIAKKYLEDTQDKFIIGGHSQGAIIASLLAIWHSDKVVAVIAEAGPFKGTAWADPVNMPIRGLVEATSIITGGKIRLRPALRRFIIPILPIVKDLAAHSEISEEVLNYLEQQEGGHKTYAFIGTGDLAVFPHRSANPPGANVTNYIVCSNEEYNKLLPVLPKDLLHIEARAGHISIVFCEEVLQKIREIIQYHLLELAQN